MEHSKQAEIETARLWKVNRTIHELIRDRVSPPALVFCAWEH